MTPDGSFSETFNSTNGNITYTGKWQIRGGVLIFAVTNASGTLPHEPVGGVDRYKIISVDSQELVYESDGQKINLSR
jgi:hypothetical protein